MKGCRRLEGNPGRCSVLPRRCASAITVPTMIRTAIEPRIANPSITRAGIIFRRAPGKGRKPCVRVESNLGRPRSVTVALRSGRPIFSFRPN